MAKIICTQERFRSQYVCRIKRKDAKAAKDREGFKINLTRLADFAV